MPAPRLLAALALALALGCGEGDAPAPPIAPPERPADELQREDAAEPAAGRDPAEASDRGASGARPAASAPQRPRRQERPLPAFEGVTLDGEPFSVSQLLGRRALVFLFDPSAAEAGPAADAVARVARARQEQNFRVVGVALGAGADAARRFAREHGLDFPIVDDPAASVASRIGLRAPAAMLGVDAEGYVVFAIGAMPAEAPNAAAAVEAQLREALRLPSAEKVAPALGIRPPAPDFRAERLEGGEPFELAALRGRPLVLMFFLYTCPHCHHALEFLKQQLGAMPEAARPALIGVSVAGSPSAVRARLEADGLDFFPVLLDLDGSVRDAYGVVAGVPDIFVIDAAGRIVTRVQGWREDRDPVLMRMWLAKIAGQKVPMLLHSTGYTGSEVCGICHETEMDTWLLTSHGHAFDTLVRHGADADPECVGCHVVGYQQPGGYTISPRTPHLEDVGCETCHGRGGPHLSPHFVQGGDYQPVCVTCHDPQHSLGFDYATFLPRISHAANAELVASLSLEERRELLARRSQVRKDILPSTAAYVGSDACRSCHAKEYETWSQSRHAHALASLAAKGETGNATCVGCHVTALGRPGGMPRDADPADHPDLARVGCESCHGPGGDHVGEGAQRVGTIVSLGDKCDSCVILQICGSCHDDANDPGFEFEVQAKIDAQRHGTIEPAASRGEGSGAAGASGGAGAPPSEARSGAPGSAAAPAGLVGLGALGAVEQGFRLLDARG